MERNSYALDETQSFLDNNNTTILPNYTLNKDSNGDFALKHQNCETASSVVLKQISQMLLSENMDENINMFPEEAALKAVEKSFYDTLGEKYPPPPNKLPFSNLSQQNPKYVDQYFLKNENLPIVEFSRGMQEGMKFLPSISNNCSLIHSLDNKHRFPSKTSEGENLVGSNLQGYKDEEWDYKRSKGKRHANCKELSSLEGRKCKISVLYFKDPDIGERLNKVLLLHGDSYRREVVRLREIMENKRKFDSNGENSKLSVDLKSLLIQCSQAIAINENKMANELIKQIKKHSSLDGNGVQRMANIFAIGLEARLAGTVDGFYNQIVDTRANHADMLSAYHILQIASPFLIVADYFTHFTILNAVGEASKLHIIHFGIDFGYRWPRLMQALSERKGMLSPSLRITGIDVPKMAHIEEVGRRLTTYARSFGIPFEYRAIGTKLEEICVEDLNIEKDELVIVICFYRMENLGREIDEMNSPKDQVLDIIRRINPNIFFQGILSVSFSGAIFAPRFKQAIQHYSALFDFLDANVPRNNKARKLVEIFLWAREAINVIACEGSERTQRPETYKQWHARNLRAGFEQLPLDHFVVKKIKEMGNNHNKSFFVEGDNEWLLLGWKGRTIKAVSTWRPKQF